MGMGIRLQTNATPTGSREAAAPARSPVQIWESKSLIARARRRRLMREKRTACRIYPRATRPYSGIVRAMQACSTHSRQAALPKSTRDALPGQPPQAPAFASSPAQLTRDAGGRHGFDASAPTRHIRSPVPCVYTHPTSEPADDGADGNRMVNIKMPPDQFCMSSSGADPLASYIQYMDFSMLNGAADACGR